MKEGTTRNGPSGASKGKKPWYRRWWVLMIAIVIVAGIAGCVGESPAADSAAKDSAVSDTEESPAADVAAGRSEDGQTDLPDASQASAGSEAVTPSPETEKDSSQTPPDDAAEPSAGTASKESGSADGASGETSAAQTTAQPTPEPSPQPVEEPESSEVQVWIPNSGSKYHSSPSCSNMKNPRQVPISQAISMGYEPCKKCY